MKGRKELNFTIWFNKKDLTVRNEKLMNNIYPVNEYEVNDDLEMLKITFVAPFVDRLKIMDNAMKNGSTIVSMG